jgi:alpha-tubulin suppressor-like RCC1 family protein
LKGIGDFKSKNYPKELTFFENIQKIACGGKFAIALTKDGKLYSWGSNYNV